MIDSESNTEYVLGEYFINTIENLQMLIAFKGLPYTLTLMPEVNHPNWVRYKGAHKMSPLDMSDFTEGKALDI